LIPFGYIVLVVSSLHVTRNGLLVLGLSSGSFSRERFPISLAHSLPHHTALLHNLGRRVVRVLRDNLTPHRVREQHVSGHGFLGSIGVGSERFLGLVNLVSVKKCLELPIARRFLIFLFLDGV